MATKVQVGDIAPDFTAPGTGGQEYSLRDYKGQTVVLVFYPGDATPVCTEQLVSYSAKFERFIDLGAQVLALSPQSVSSHETFSAKYGFRFPLLFDENKQIGESYGVVGMIGFYRRSVFVIDGDGIIRFARRSSAGLDFVRTDVLLEAVAAANATPAA